MQIRPGPPADPAPPSSPLRLRPDGAAERSPGPAGLCRGSPAASARSVIAPLCQVAQAARLAHGQRELVLWSRQGEQGLLAAQETAMLAPLGEVPRSRGAPAPLGIGPDALDHGPLVVAA